MSLFKSFTSNSSAFKPMESTMAMFMHTSSYRVEILSSLEDEHNANIPYSGECLIQGKSKVWIGISRAGGSKCERCWNYSQHVGSFSDHPTLCSRCYDVVAVQMPPQVAVIS